MKAVREVEHVSYDEEHLVLDTTLEELANLRDVVRSALGKPDEPCTFADGVGIAQVTIQVVNVKTKALVGDVRLKVRDRIALGEKPLRSSP